MSTPPPPGDELYARASLRYLALKYRVERKGGGLKRKWAKLPPAELTEMREVMDMWMEAADPEGYSHPGAQCAVAERSLKDTPSVTREYQCPQTHLRIQVRTLKNQR